MPQLLPPHPVIALGGTLIIATVQHYRAGQIYHLEEQLLYIGIIALLAVSSLLWLARSTADPERVKKGGMPRGVKVSMAAFLLVSGLMVIGTLALLPLVGISVFKVLVGPWSPFLLIGGAVLFLPFIEKRVH